ncbi:hypothetical protein Lal_00024397 [Lupinus albus]|nr:hypothetical protein Lal_00024397 [Lupinus albus]
MLSPLVFFPISTHFTAPPEIPSAPTLLQLDGLRPIILDNAYILCLTAAAGIELADAYSPDTVIASSLGKEVHDPPSVADHPLGPATDHHLGKLLPHQLANQTSINKEKRRRVELRNSDEPRPSADCRPS